MATTLAMLVRVALVSPWGMAAAVRATTLVTVAMAPAFRVPRLATTLVAFRIAVPWDEPAETAFTPAGRRLVNITEVAVFGPLLVTVKM